MSDQPIVLFVDDDAWNRVVFEASFDQEFNTQVADGGESALAFLEKERVAVIVSDQRMNGLKGNELLAKVRERWPRTIRIIATAYQDVNAILQAVNEGLVARYIIKPWDEDELRGVIKWGLQAYGLAFETDGNVLQARLLESEKLAALGAVQASFLHELGAPLAYIYNSVDELVRLEGHSAKILELIDKDANQTQEWRDFRAFIVDYPEILNNLRTGASLLTHLREDVHCLVKTASSETANISDDAAVRRAIKFAIAVNKQEATLANVALRFEAPEQIPDLQISPENLMMVLINLIRNAIQAHLPDKVGNEVVTLVDSGADGMASISIADNGVGMADEVCNAVGKQFYTTKKAGTGLGVFRCKAVIASTGGSLEYKSTLGVGTTALATIPMYSGDHEQVVANS